MSFGQCRIEIKPILLLVFGNLEKFTSTFTFFISLSLGICGGSIGVRSLPLSRSGGACESFSLLALSSPSMSAAPPGVLQLRALAASRLHPFRSVMSGKSGDLYLISSSLRTGMYGDGSADLRSRVRCGIAAEVFLAMRGIRRCAADLGMNIFQPQIRLQREYRPSPQLLCRRLTWKRAWESLWPFKHEKVRNISRAATVVARAQSLVALTVGRHLSLRRAAQWRTKRRDDPSSVIVGPAFSGSDECLRPMFEYDEEASRPRHDISQPLSNPPKQEHVSNTRSNALD